jgi:hypothetical protein
LRKKESILIDWLAKSSDEHRKRLTYLSVLLLFIAAGFFYYIYYLMEYGYLPSPFIYDKSNTFMDFFNTLFWAYEEGRYSDWGSVYPPLGFIILRIVNYLFSGSLFGDAELIRDNSPFVLAGICLIYLAVPALILSMKYWRGFLTGEKILLYFAIILSSPMLFTLERGNLIVLAPVFLAFALSNIGMARSLSIALLINLKPYFALLLIYYFARKNWKGLASCIGISGLIFAITGIALDNNFLYFFVNLFSFSQDAELFSLREVMALPSSISAFSYILNHPDGAMFAAGFLSPERVTILIYLIEKLKWGALGIALAALFISADKTPDAELFALLVVFISNLGIWVGGYTYILYVALIPVVIRMRANWLYIILISLIALPVDIIPMLGDYIGTQFSYLANEKIEIFWTMGLGSVLRPTVNIFLLMLLSYELLARKNIFASIDSLRQIKFLRTT